MENEIWKSIPGYEGLYEASSLGRIKSVPKRTKTSHGTYTIRKERIFKMNTRHRDGYVLVIITKDQTPATLLAHRIVADTHIPNPKNKPFINHKNGIKDDNRIENLEWCTRSENAIHSFEIGLQCNKGEQHPQAKLTNDIVNEIRQKYIPFVYTSRRIAKEYGLSKTNVLDIVNRKSWTHI